VRQTEKWLEKFRLKEVMQVTKVEPWFGDVTVSSREDRNGQRESFRLLFMERTPARTRQLELSVFGSSVRKDMAKMRVALCSAALFASRLEDIESDFAAFDWVRYARAHDAERAALASLAGSARNAVG